MEKFKIIFKLALNFFKNYWIDYIALMIIPILLVSLSTSIFFGVAVVATLMKGQQDTVQKFPLLPTITPETTSALMIIFLIGFLLFAYAVWRMCFICYGLNHAVYGFIKQEEPRPLQEYIKEIKRDEKGLIAFILKSSLLALVPVLLIFVYFYTIGSLKVANGQFSNSALVEQVNIVIFIIVCFLWTILLIPYFMFMFQAYYYREDEKCFTIFIDCYKNLDSCAGLIFLFGLLAQTVVNAFNIPLVSQIASLLVSMFVYLLSSFWFFVKKFKIRDYQKLPTIDN